MSRRTAWALTRQVGAVSTLIVAAELDALRAQIERYAAKAQGFGVPVTFRLIEGADHDFPFDAKTPAAIRELAELNRDHLLANLA